LINPMRTFFIALMMTLATQVGAEEVTAGKILKLYDSNDPLTSRLAESYLNGLSNGTAASIALSKVLNKKMVCPHGQMSFNSELAASFIRAQVEARPDFADRTASEVFLFTIFEFFPCSD